MKPKDYSMHETLEDIIAAEEAKRTDLSEPFRDQHRALRSLLSEGSSYREVGIFQGTCALYQLGAGVKYMELIDITWDHCDIRDKFDDFAERNDVTIKWMQVEPDDLFPWHQSVDVTFIDGPKNAPYWTHALNAYSKVTDKAIMVHDTELVKDRVGSTFIDFVEANPEWKINEINNIGAGYTLLTK